jgi:signal transduction histidine kinase
MASSRGVALSVVTLAGAAMLCTLAVAVALGGLGFGLLLIPEAVLASRRLLNRVRRLAGDWCGVPIEVPYQAQPGAGTPRFWRRFGWLLNDRATWRDLLWMAVDSAVGWILTLGPATLLLYGLFGTIIPAVQPPIAHAGGGLWYAFVPVTSTLSAWLAVPLGLVLMAAALWAAPRSLRWYGAFARSMLGPARQAELTRRVSQLAQTRSETLDASAAELRRIERDLHDGAQARLVAMGMTLDAADQLLDEDPVAARALLAEARSSSVQALAELRDLVRGIHPPVLADRGLDAALRALALDSPLNVQITGGLPGRVEKPVESAAYFAVCELLVNVTKHARAGSAWIDLRYERSALRADVGDDGHGGADPSLGSGLAGIARRLAAFDGVLAISSPPGGPTVVSMEIPCVLSSPKICSS